MKNNHYCDSCRKEVSYTIKTNNIYKFRNCVVEVNENIPICNICGEEIFIADIENDNLKRLYDKYRWKNGMITTEGISLLLDKYNMTDSELASILGCHTITILKYKKGNLPTRPYGVLMQKLLNNERIFKKYVTIALEEKKMSIETWSKLTNL